MQERQTVLRFSLGGTAVQVACGLLLTAGCGYLVYEFGFRFEDVPERASRNQLLWDFFRTNNGMTGAIIWTLAGLVCGWWTWVAGRRVTASGKAAVLTEQGLMLHPSYSREGIPYRDILSTEIRSHGALIHSLYVGVANRRRIRIQSNTVEGGKEALEAFAAELNARRTFGGQAAQS